MTTQVGIMSMQRILNYGSTLQSYALRRLIEATSDDIRVSFIDYQPGAPLAPTSEGQSRLIRAVSKVREYGEVSAPLAEKLRFINHKRTYAKKYFSLVGVPREADYDTNVDVQVIGSDEVFNCVQANANVGYARSLFGHGSDARRIVSYAGSFGNTTLRKIEDYGIRQDLEQDFSRFHAVSVRDRNSADIVEALTGVRPSINIDPVLAHDFMRSEDRIPAKRMHERKYVILYGYPGRISRAESMATKQYARRIGADVLSIGGVQEGADRFIDCNPFELLAYFRDAEAVVTDTFHGTIFSIINGTPFATLIRRTEGDGYGNEEKLGYLLEIFGLASRRVEELASLEQTLAAPIDIEAVNETLRHHRQSTSEYLRRAMSGMGKADMS